MNGEERHSAESGEFEHLLELPPGRERDLLLSTMPPQALAEAQQMLEAADLVWAEAHGAPALEDDPVAAMLGLVPDPGYQLDAAALKRARSRAHVKPTALAAALGQRGWSVSAGDVFTWENSGGASVAPALVSAVADELHTSPDALAVPPASSRRVASHAQPRAALVAGEVAKTPRFQELVRRFARVQQMSQGMAGSALQSRMLATVHRGQHPTPDQMLAALLALVEALESNEQS